MLFMELLHEKSRNWSKNKTWSYAPESQLKTRVSMKVSVILLKWYYKNKQTQVSCELFNTDDVQGSILHVFHSFVCFQWYYDQYCCGCVGSVTHSLFQQTFPLCFGLSEFPFDLNQIQEALRAVKTKGHVIRFFCNIIIIVVFYFHFVLII